MFIFNNILSQFTSYQNTTFLTARQLFTHDMNGSDQAKIIEVISLIPEDQRKSLIQDIKRFITSDMNGDDKVNIVDTFIRWIPHKTRKAFIQDIERLITSDMDTDNRRTIINELAAFPGPGMYFMQEIIKFTTPDMNDHDRAILFEHISQLNRTRMFQDHFNGLESDTVFKIKRSDLKEHPKETALNYFNTIIRLNGKLPQIVYLNEQGIDAGGLTRNFITNLFQAIGIQDDENVFNIRAIDHGVIIQLEKEDDIKPSQAIGTIFGAALTGQAFTVGKVFHPVLFYMIHSLTQEEVAKIPKDLKKSTDIPSDILEKLSNLYLDTMNPDDNIDSIRMAYPVAVIAKSMFEYLNQFDSSQP